MLIFPLEISTFPRLLVVTICVVYLITFAVTWWLARDI